MFDKAIIDTDRFMDMGMPAKALYFLLGMDADDEGFVSYKKVMRVHGGNDDDIKILVAKKFIIPFQSGVVVITDWNVNNYLDSNRTRATEYQKEKKMLLLTDKKRYEFNNGSTSIEESSIEEKSIDTPAPTSGSGDEIGKFIGLFGGINPSYDQLFKRAPQRKATERLLKKHPLDWWVKFMEGYEMALEDQFCPRATTPMQMEDKLGAIMVFARSKKGLSAPPPSKKYG